jgi:hypothetical protein
MPHPKRMFAQKKKVTIAENTTYPFVFDPSGAFGADFGKAVVSVNVQEAKNGRNAPLQCCWSYEAAKALAVFVFDDNGVELVPADVGWTGRTVEIHVIAAES